MGGEFGDEDERLITRLENTQYDGTSALDHENHPAGGFGHAESPNAWQVDRGGGGAGGPAPPQSQLEQDKKSPAISQ